MGCVIELRNNATQSRGWINGSAEPLLFGRRLLPVVKDWVGAPIGLPGVEEHCTLTRTSGRNGDVLVSSQDALVWQGLPYNQQGKSGGGCENGSWGHRSEDGGAAKSLRSKGPLGEGWSVVGAGLGGG
jgi:hypothetical protein